MPSPQLSTTIETRSSSMKPLPFALLARLTAARRPAYSARLPDRPTSLFSQELLPARGTEHEANLSTQQFAPQAHARLPRTHGHECGTKGSRQPPREGPRASHALAAFGFGATLLPDTARFPPDQRLHAPAEFGRVFAEPARSTDRFFTVLARPSGRPVARLGLTVSRRVAKRAVDRNKLKRLARESFRQQRALPPWDFVVLARAGAALAARPELRASLDRHFEQLSKAGGAARQHG